MKKQFVSVAALAIALGGSSAFAQRFPGSSWAPPQERSERDVPLNQVLRDLRSQYGGQHLDAQKQDGRYIISWVTDDGRRMVIEVDASTGRTLSTRG